MKCTPNIRQIHLTFGGAFFMAKYSYEEKVAAVKLILDDGLSTYEAAKISGISRTPIVRWLERYKQFGPEGLLMKHGTYDGAFKVSVIEYMHAHHLSVFQTGVKFGIPNDTIIGNWERIYYEEGPQGLCRNNRGKKKKMNPYDPKETKLDRETEEDLIAEVQRLRMENEYLKKLNALVQERIARENGKEPPSLMN